MNSDFHFKIDGVGGESLHKSHKGEIEVISWSWGVANAATNAGGGSGRGKASGQDFSFTHRYSKASPVLAKHCVSGKHFKEAVFVGSKSGESQQEFLKITMKEVFITSVNHGGGGDGEILETVTCSYGDVEYAYKPQDAKGGMGGEVKFGWDIKTTETR
jgi:type VI secretion system secreted protein Hcp